MALQTPFCLRPWIDAVQALPSDACRTTTERRTDELAAMFETRAEELRWGTLPGAKEIDPP